jgi:hypothetical protein
MGKPRTAEENAGKAGKAEAGKAEENTDEPGDQPRPAEQSAA